MRIKDSVHTYLGKPISNAGLEIKTISECIRNCKHDHRVWYRFYSGSRCIQETSFSDYLQLCCSFSSSLCMRYGLKNGNRVIVRLGNSEQCLVAYGALLLLGAVIVAVDPKEEGATLLHIARDSGAVGAISLGDESELEAKGLWVQSFTNEILNDCRAKNDIWPECKSVSTDLALIVYTSGTTGLPKGVLLTHEKIMVNAEAVRRLHSMDEEHVHLCVLPLFHVNAFNFSFIATLYSRCRFILNRSFYLPAFWDILRNEKVHVASVVPTIINLLAEDKRNFDAGVVSPALKYFVSAAAPLSQGLAGKFVERFGVRINQGYGLSEAVNFSLTLPPDLTKMEYQQYFLEQNLPPAGAAVWGNEVAIVDREGVLLNPGETGEVVLRGWNVMDGYLNRSEDNNQAFQHDWFHTGDRGYYKICGKHKLFFLVGRLKELIIRKGEKISPVAVEAKINVLPGLSQIAVVGFNNKYVGEEIGLYVVPGTDTTDAAKILSDCCKLLGQDLAPKAIIFGKFLPRTRTGKLKRNSIKEYFIPYAMENYA